MAATENVINSFGLSYHLFQHGGGVDLEYSHSAGPLTIGVHAGYDNKSDSWSSVSSRSIKFDDEVSQVFRLVPTVGWQMGGFFTPYLGVGPAHYWQSENEVDVRLPVNAYIDYEVEKDFSNDGGWTAVVEGGFLAHMPLGSRIEDQQSVPTVNFGPAISYLIGAPSPVGIVFRVGMGASFRRE